MEPRRRQPELALAPGLAGDDIQGRGCRERALQPDEGRLAWRQLRRREVRVGWPDDRPLAVITAAPSARPPRGVARATRPTRPTWAPGPWPVRAVRRGLQPLRADTRRKCGACS